MTWHQNNLCRKQMKTGTQQGSFKSVVSPEAKLNPIQQVSVTISVPVQLCGEEFTSKSIYLNGWFICYS